MTDRALTEHISATLSGDAIGVLADLVGAARPVEVLDIGSSPLVGEPPCYTALFDAGWAHVTGFEPNPEALAALQEADAGPQTAGRARHLGHAIGDGAEHTLHVCDAAGFSSLLRPDAEQLAVLTDFPRLAAVVSEEPVRTIRLDDVPDLGTVDLVALDVQGSEPVIIDGGSRTLAEVFAVQVEVGFHRLYEHGPTLADVDTRLRALGLVPHMFVTTRTWPMAPIGWDDPLADQARHLVEADLLYVRDPAHLYRASEDTLRVGVLIACAAYGSVGLAFACVQELVRRGSLPHDATSRLRDLVTSSLDLRKDGDR